MKIYISGPMTGLPDYNYPAFNRAAAAGMTVGDVIQSAEQYLACADLELSGLTTFH